MKHYEIKDLGYGMLVTAPNGGDRFFSGIDAQILSDELAKIEKIWCRKFGTGFRKSYGPFKSQEEHQDILLSSYF